MKHTGNINSNVHVTSEIRGRMSHLLKSPPVVEKIGLDLRVKRFT